MIIFYFAGLESKPKPSELQLLVKPHVAERWEELGTALGLADDDDGEQLDKIQENRNGDSGMCFSDTMKLWLRRSGGSSQATWAMLMKAIKSIKGCEAAVAQIEAQLLSSTTGNNFKQVSLIIIIVQVTCSLRPHSNKVLV